MDSSEENHEPRAASRVYCPSGRAGRGEGAPLAHDSGRAKEMEAKKSNGGSERSANGDFNGNSRTAAAESQV